MGLGLKAGYRGLGVKAHLRLAISRVSSVKPEPCRASAALLSASISPRSRASMAEFTRWGMYINK